MTSGVYSLYMPMTPDVLPQQLVVVSNVLLATRYGCNSLLLLNSQGSISAILAIRLQVGGGLQGCTAARLHGCMAARLHGCTAARLQGCMAARLHGCMAARLHGCKAARLSELELLQVAALLVQLSCNG